MLFTIKKPKSQRSFQLSFKGFSPRGRNIIEKNLFLWLDFFNILRTYVIRKLELLFWFISKLLFWLFKLPLKVKSFIIKKLIWSRGRLGRPVATISVMGVAFVVFLLGEVFSSSELVVAQPAPDVDYLASVTDIMPKREIATTTVPDARKRNEPFAYAIEGGDTLSSIGEKFKISTDALKYVNGLTDGSILKVGQQITIPPVAGLIHKVATGDTLNSIALKYEVAPQTIADFNYILDVSTLSVGTELVIPNGKIPAPVIPIMPAYDPSMGGGALASANKDFCVWPTTVRIVTQTFSWYHNGIDIATPWGQQMPPLLACTGGKVIRSGWDTTGLGLHIIIDHGNGYITVYGHMSRLDVGYGERVKRGQIIGLMGSTGRSTGPHIHFMVKYNGTAQNPFNFTR